MNDGCTYFFRVELGIFDALIREFFKRSSFRLFAKSTFDRIIIVLKKECNYPLKIRNKVDESTVWSFTQWNKIYFFILFFIILLRFLNYFIFNSIWENSTKKWKWGNDLEMRSLKFDYITDGSSVRVGNLIGS